MENNSAPKVYRDGKVAVLYSSEYGSGWYSDNTYFPECLFAPEIVNWILVGKPRDSIPSVREIFPYASEFDFRCSLASLEIEWVETGEEFWIESYDGKETIILKRDMRFLSDKMI